MQEQSKARKSVNLYVDGICAGQAAAWACILEFGGHQKELCGHMAGSTEARMEVFALISGLGALKEPCDVCLYTKSMPLHRAFNERGLQIWPTTGWKHKDGSPVADKDLWMLLSLQARKRQLNIKCIYAPDFKALPINRRCTELAKGAIGEYTRINTPKDDEVFDEEFPDDEEEQPGG